MEQPQGHVTLVFTDIEGSTRLLRGLGEDGYRSALGEHRRKVREAFGRYGGYEVDYEGDAFFYAFGSAADAVSAVVEAQRSLEGGPITIRAGVHTGTPGLDPPKYVGLDVHLAARIMSAGHGGQVLLSQATRELVHAEVRDLGEHRLKDFDEAVSIFQLGDGEFPPLKTIANTNLPRPASSFVGREREVTEVVSLIRDGSRLVTLTGPGGSGKTRLALEAAAELVGEFRGGVFWVGLSALRDPALVLPTIAQALGAGDDVPAHVAEKELLLLLDNLEQVVGAAPDLAELVEACPNLRLLVTSRELLRVRGEAEYEVLPLADPDAVELFCARARVQPEPAVVELCGRLDNMPLALELAAARAKVLSPGQILERLGERLDLFTGGRDADPRQQTLRATIEWSHDLLGTEEQRLFARLSVFTGGCTLQAAEVVCDADLDTLQSLVEKSLLRHTQERFWMLETIQEFASERRRDRCDAAELEQRHGRFFLELARAAEAGERGPDQTVWWNRLEDEVDNLRASLDRAHRRGDHLEELELAVVLKRFWHAHGRVREGKLRIEEALAAAPEAEGLARARALAALSYCAANTGDPSSAAELAESALQFYSDIGDTAGVARMTLDLGVAADLGGDARTARGLYERARVLAREVGDVRYEYFAGHNLANQAFLAGDYSLAVERGEESLAVAHATGDPSNVQTATVLLAYVLAGAGRAREARNLVLGFLTETATAGTRWVVRDALELVAVMDAEDGLPERAALLAGLTGRLREESGEPRQTSGAQLFDPALERVETLLGMDRFRETLARGAAMTLEEAVALASAPLQVSAP